MVAKNNEDFDIITYLTLFNFYNKLQFGLGNLNHGFKHISSLFLLMSLTYLPFFEYYLFNLSNFLFYLFFILFFIKKYFLKKIKS